MKKSSELLLETHAAIVIDSTSTAIHLVMNHPEWFEPPEEGIYNKHNTDPVLTPEGIYYHPNKPEEPMVMQSGVTVETVVKSFPNGVVDKDGIYLITPVEIRNADKMLDVLPTHYKAPHVILESVARDIISRCVNYKRIPYKTGSSLLNPMEYRHYLTEIGEKACLSGEFEAECAETFLNRIRDFVYENPWAIYFVNRVDADIVIERSVDYRIYDWTDRMMSDQEE